MGVGSGEKLRINNPNVPFFMGLLSNLCIINYSFCDTLTSSLSNHSFRSSLLLYFDNFENSYVLNNFFFTLKSIIFIHTKYVFVENVMIKQLCI